MFTHITGSSLKGITETDDGFFIDPHPEKKEGKTALAAQDDSRRSELEEPLLQKDEEAKE